MNIISIFIHLQTLYYNILNFFIPFKSIKIFNSNNSNNSNNSSNSKNSCNIKNYSILMYTFLYFITLLNINIFNNFVKYVFNNSGSKIEIVKCVNNVNKYIIYDNPTNGSNNNIIINSIKFIQSKKIQDVLNEQVANNISFIQAHIIDNSGINSSINIRHLILRYYSTNLEHHTLSNIYLFNHDEFDNICLNNMILKCKFIKMSNTCGIINKEYILNNELLNTSLLNLFG